MFAGKVHVGGHVPAGGVHQGAELRPLLAERAGDDVPLDDGVGACLPGDDGLEHGGSSWTGTAMDRDSKIVISNTAGDWSQATAREFMFDLSSRVAGWIQLITEGHGAYLKAVTDGTPEESHT